MIQPQYSNFLKSVFISSYFLMLACSVFCIGFRNIKNIVEPLGTYWFPITAVTNYTNLVTQYKFIIWLLCRSEILKTSWSRAVRKNLSDLLVITNSPQQPLCHRFTTTGLKTPKSSCQQGYAPSANSRKTMTLSFSIPNSVFISLWPVPSRPKLSILICF